MVILPLNVNEDCFQKCRILLNEDQNGRNEEIMISALVRVTNSPIMSWLLFVCVTAQITDTHEAPQVSGPSGFLQGCVCFED